MSTERLVEVLAPTRIYGIDPTALAERILSSSWLADFVEGVRAAERERLAARVWALGQDGSPGSLMEDIRAELTTVTGDPGIASAYNTRVMHQIREHIRDTLRR